MIFKKEYTVFEDTNERGLEIDSGGEGKSKGVRGPYRRNLVTVRSLVPKVKLFSVLN